METIENIFNYNLSDYLSTAETLHIYGFNGHEFINSLNQYVSTDNSIIDICSLIRIINNNLYIDTSNALISFYYSYHCKFDESIALNTAVRKNYLNYGYENDKSAASRIRKIKADIITEDTELYCYLKKVFDGMKHTHKGTLSPYDADILIQSVISYYKSPFHIRDGYTVKLLNTFIQSFKKVLNDNDKTKNRINSYIFERIYHINLIYTIADFYKIFNDIIDKTNYEGFSFKCPDAENKYFKTNMLMDSLLKYTYENRTTVEQTKNAYKKKCKEFAVDLCEFAIIPDIYTRKQELCRFIDENIQNITDEKLYLDKLHITVSRAARKSIINNKIFYYSCIFWSVIRTERELVEKLGEKACDYIWKNLFSTKYMKECLAYDLQDIKNIIDDSAFDLHIMDLSTNFPECDDIINDLLQKTLFGIQVFNINKQILKSPLIDDEFTRKYNNLVEEALNQPLLGHCEKHGYEKIYQTGIL